MKPLPYRRLAVIVLSALAVASCAELPFLGERAALPRPDPQDIRLGALTHPKVLKASPALDHADLQAYINEVGQRVAKHSRWPQLAWQFTVLDSSDVNAFALPGGYVYLTRGLLAYLNSEAELAGVMGHEIGHVVARHAAGTGLSEAGEEGPLPQGWTAGYGRERELEATRLGAEALARAGYNPQAMLDAMDTLKQQARYVAAQPRADARRPATYHAAADLPSGADARLRRIVDEADAHAVPLPRDGHNDYLQRIAGLSVGERPEGGVLRENLLLHDGFGLALQFPPGWQVRSQPQQVVATSPGDDAWVELRRASGPPQDALQQVLQFDEGARYTTGVLSGFPATFAAGAQQGRPVIAAAAMLDDTSYVIAGVAKDAVVYARERATLRGAINSFRAITAEEKQSLRPHVLRVVNPRPGMSMAALAQQSPLQGEGDAEAQLRLLNGLYPKGEPKPGRLIKIVQ